MLSIVAEDMSNSCNSLDSNFGGNLNCTDDRELRTPLMWACALGNAYVASSLLMYTVGLPQILKIMKNISERRIFHDARSTRKYMCDVRSNIGT